MTTIEILQAAIDEGCTVEVQKSIGGLIYCEIDGNFVDAWASESTIQESIQSAWSNYQTNKNQ